MATNGSKNGTSKVSGGFLGGLYTKINPTPSNSDALRKVAEEKRKAELQKQLSDWKSDVPPTQKELTGAFKIAVEEKRKAEIELEKRKAVIEEATKAYVANSTSTSEVSKRKVVEEVEKLRLANAAFTIAENKVNDYSFTTTRNDKLKTAQESPKLVTQTNPSPDLKIVNQTVTPIPEQNTFSPPNVTEGGNNNQSNITENWEEPPPQEFQPVEIIPDKSKFKNRSNSIDNKSPSLLQNIVQNNSLSNKQKPTIMMVSKFNKLVKDSEKNKEIKNSDFNSGVIFNSLTPDGQYFDLQIQSRYLDHLSLQYIYNKLSESTKTLLDNKKNENINVINDLKNSVESLKNIFIYTDLASQELFSYQELIEDLIDVKLLSNNSTVLKEWNSFKTWSEFIAVTMNSISSYSKLLTRDNTTVTIHDPENSSGIAITKEKDFLIASKLSQVPDAALSLIRYNDPNFELIDYSGRIANNSSIDDVSKSWFQKSIPNFQPYKLFSLLTQEILFSINKVRLNSTDFQNLLGYNKYGTFDITEIPTYYTRTTLASLPWITIGENELDNRFLAGTLEENELNFGKTNVKSGKEHFVLNSIYSINNQGVIQTDNITNLKNKFQNTINKLEQLRKYLYTFNNVEEESIPYITDPVNRIIKDLTTEESTTQKLVFTEAQSLNVETRGEELIKDAFTDSKTYLTGEPWVIGLIKLCYHYQNQGYANKYGSVKKIPAMWHLLDALLSNSSDKIEKLVKKVIYVYNSVNTMEFQDPLGPGRTGSGKASFGARQMEDALNVAKSDGEQNQVNRIKKINSFRQIAIAQRETLIKSFEQSETWSALSNIIKSYKKLLKIGTEGNKTNFNSIHDLYILYQILVSAVQIIDKMPWKLNLKIQYVDSVGTGGLLLFNSYDIIFFQPQKVPENDGTVNIQQYDCLIKSETSDFASLNSGVPSEDLEQKLTFVNPQRMFDKLSLFLYKKKNLIEKLESDIITSGNLSKLSNLFYLNSNNTKLNDVFNFSSTQIYSILTRVNDLNVNFSKESSVNLLNNQIITTKTAKTAIYNQVKALPYGDIVTIGIPKGLIKSKIDATGKVIKVILSRINELEENSNYKDIIYYFDLNVFPVWDFDRYNSVSGPTLRTFKKDFSLLDFSNSTYQYSKELTDEIKNEINYNHKLSVIFDLYLSVFTGIQVNETSVFSDLVTNQIISVNGLMTTNEIKNAVMADPINASNSLVTKNQIKLFLNTLNTYSDSKMIKMFTTHPTQYDRVFNIFVPYSGTPTNAIWEYQIKIDDGEEVITSTTDKLPEGGSAAQDAVRKPVEEVNLGRILGGLNPEQFIRYGDSGMLGTTNQTAAANIDAINSRLAGGGRSL